MGNLRYVELGPERLRDTVKQRDFVTVRYMNEVLERAACLIGKTVFDGTFQSTVERIRALKEKA